MTITKFDECKHRMFHYKDGQREKAECLLLKRDAYDYYECMHIRGGCALREEAHMMAQELEEKFNREDREEKEKEEAMKDPNKFTPGCRNKECKYYDDSCNCKCSVIGWAEIPSDDAHEFSCERLSCYNPKPRPEKRWVARNTGGIVDTKSGEIFFRFNSVADYLNEVAP